MKIRVFLPFVLLLVLSLFIGGCSRKEYSLTIDVSGQGTTIPGAGTNTYKEAGSLTITATPANGWQFDGWSGDVSGSDAAVAIRVDAKKQVTANFSKIKYNLSISVNGSGTTDPAAGSVNCDPGSVVNVTATPANGWKFDNWSGDVSGSDAAVFIDMDGNKNVTANFSKIKYGLTISVNGSGTTDPAAGSIDCDPGSIVNVTATPANGWQFDSWSGDVSGTDTTISIRMDGNKDVTANFLKIKYTLTITIDGSGTTNPAAGSVSCSAGSIVNVTATPANGWQFDRWIGDASGTDATVSIRMDGNKNVTAVFWTGTRFTSTAALSGLTSANSLAAAQQSLQSFLSQYGLTIEITKITPSDYANTCITYSLLQDNDLGTLKTYGALFIDEWAKYPIDWITSSQLKSIVLVKKLGVNTIGPTVAAFPDIVGETMYYDVTYSGNYAREVVHHEFDHLIIYNIFHTSAPKDSTWLSLNPPGFSYGAGGASAYQPGYSGPSGEHVVPGFVTGYATTAIEEDMAETYAYLMTTTYYHHLQNWLFSDTDLTNKVNYYKQFISKYSPEMSGNYFDEINP